MATGNDLIQEFTGGKGYITSTPGYRSDPFTGTGSEYHSGYDIGGLSGGYPVTPSFSGEAVSMPYSDIWGNRVLVGNPQTQEAYYLNHLGQPGQSGSFQPGQTVGFVGSTGRSTATHLDVTAAAWDEVKHLFSSGLQKAVQIVGSVVKVPVNQLTQEMPKAEKALGGQTRPTSGPPAGFSGYWGDTPYVSGTAQTKGGGFAPDGSYSAGYHGGGGNFYEDRGPWGTGKNMGPIVNNTVQTGGGNFYYDENKGTYEYSAGYHGSGEHPEITGNSTPGEYQSGSFGSILSPDLSNPGKAGDFLKYLKSMGYDVSPYLGWTNQEKLTQQYHDSGGTFDGLSFIKNLPQANAQKTELISQYASSPMMPTKQVQSLLGGSNFSKLFSQDVSSPVQQPSSALSEANQAYQTVAPTSITTTKQTSTPAVVQTPTGLGGVAGIVGLYGDDDVLKSRGVI